MLVQQTSLFTVQQLDRTRGPGAVKPGSNDLSRLKRTGWLIIPQSQHESTDKPESPGF